MSAWFRFLTSVLLFVALFMTAWSGEVAWTVALGALMVTRAIDGLRMDLKERQP